MNVSFRILLFIMISPGALGTPGTAAAHEWAGLRVANAVGEGTLQVESKGRTWQVGGLKSGEVSALRRLKPGSHRLTFSVDGMLKREIRLSLKPSQCITLVAHMVVAPRVGMEPPRVQINVLKLESAPMVVGRVATVVDLGVQARRFLEIRQVGASWSPITLRRLEPQRFYIQQHRGYLPLRHGQQRLASMPVFEQGHHVLVLYENGQGQLSSISFLDRPWPTSDVPMP